MIPLWYLIAGMATAYALGIWIGWVARSHKHDRFVEQVREEAVEWNS